MNYFDIEQDFQDYVKVIDKPFDKKSHSKQKEWFDDTQQKIVKLLEKLLEQEPSIDLQPHFHLDPMTEVKDKEKTIKNYVLVQCLPKYYSFPDNKTKYYHGAFIGISFFIHSKHHVTLGVGVDHSNKAEKKKLPPYKDLILKPSDVNDDVAIISKLKPALEETIKIFKEKFMNNKLEEIDKIIDDLKKYWSGNPKFNDFAIGTEKNKNWFWIFNPKYEINSESAHYELIRNEANSKRFSVELHFEGDPNMIIIQSSVLNSDLEQKKWEKTGQLIRFKAKTKRFDPKSDTFIADVANTLLELDKEVGKLVYDSITKLKMDTTPHSTVQEQAPPLNQILFGPPGTGKTYNTINKALEIIDPDFKNVDDRKAVKSEFDKHLESGRIMFTTFHQNMSYEDFIEGIKPIPLEGNGAMTFKVKKGIFREICEKATNDNQKNYVLIIDEINRGNVSKIFGELITLIEDDKRLNEAEALKITLPYSKEPFGVPNNLYIIGTMNTADRSVEALDTALRRRFSFVEMPPQYELDKLKREICGYSLRNILETINNRIKKLLGKDNLIGHSYFLSVETENGLKAAFQNKIIPLLQEYFFGDYGKIGWVLGKGFVEKDASTEDISADFEYDGYGLLDKPIYSIKSVLKMNNDDFKIALSKLINKK